MLTAAQLTDFLETQLQVVPQLADDAYSLPAENWVANDFASGLFSLFHQLNFTWQPERSDCDDFARFASAYAGCLHARMNKESGIAFGEFWYRRDADGGGHAINAFVVRAEGGALALRFFEPQTQQLVILSRNEIFSCDYCRF